MSEQIVYRINKNRRKMLFEGDIPETIEELNEAKESVYLKSIIDTWNMIDKFGIKKYEEERGFIKISKSDYEKMLNGSANKNYIRNLLVKTVKESADIPEPKEKDVEKTELVDLESSETVKGDEEKKAPMTCACGGKNFVEEDGELICNDCGRHAVFEPEVDEEGGDLPKKDQMKESAEVAAPPEEDQLKKKIKEAVGSSKTVGDYMNDEDKKRPKGHRIVRSEPTPMTTAKRPAIADAIAEAVSDKEYTGTYYMCTGTLSDGSYKGYFVKSNNERDAVKKLNKYMKKQGQSWKYGRPGNTTRVNSSIISAKMDHSSDYTLISEDNSSNMKTAIIEALKKM